MIGLIVKDILTIRKYFKTVGVVFLIWCVIFIPRGSVGVLAAMFCIMTVMVAVNSMGYDEAAKWDRLALTMPLTRRELVLSKYLLMLLLGLAGCLLALLLGFAASFFIPVNLGEMLVTAAVSFLVALLYASIVLPFIYKLGVEKARLVMLTAFLAPYALFMLLGQVLDFNLQALMELSFGALLSAGIILTVLIVVVSYRISLTLYQKKDL